MALLSKRKWNPKCHLVASKVDIRWQHIILLWFMYSCIKKIWQSCECLAVGPALQSNSSNCLVLILHRQLGNFSRFSRNPLKFLFHLKQVHVLSILGHHIAKCPKIASAQLPIYCPTVWHWCKLWVQANKFGHLLKYCGYIQVCCDICTLFQTWSCYH